MTMKLNLQATQNGVYEEDQDQPENNICGVLSCFREMLDTGLFTDVKVICGPVEIPAHKSVLAARIPFFKEVLQNDTAENTIVTISEEISVETLKLIIDYAYFKQPKITLENAQDVLEAAAYFRIEDLSQFCDQFVADHIVLTVQDCLAVQSFADGKGAEVLAKAARGFVAKHLAVVSTTDAFRGLSGKEIKFVLSSDHLDGLPGEEFFWEALVKWIQADVGNRKAFMPELVGLLRLLSFSINDIVTKMLPHPYIDTNPICRQMIHDMLGYMADPGNEELRGKCAAVFSFQKRSSSRHICFFNSYPKTSRGANTLQMLQSPNSKWMKQPIGHFGSYDGSFVSAVGVGDTAYCVSRGNSLISYTPSTKTWVRVTNDKDRPEKLYSLKMCSLNGKLVGCELANDSHGQRLLFCYCYDPSTNCWEKNSLDIKEGDLKHLHLRGVCGVTLNGQNADYEMLCVNLNVVGQDGMGVFVVYTLHVIDLSTGSLIRRGGNTIRSSGGTSCFGYKGKVFVVVHEDMKPITIEVYHVMQNEWSTLPYMNVARGGCELVVANDCLYVIGGFVFGSDLPDLCLSVEYLDLTDTNSDWQDGPKLLDLKDVDDAYVPSCYAAAVC